MSDYTTETVREDLIQTSSWRFMQHEIGENFERWLAQHDAAVWDQGYEQARIDHDFGDTTENPYRGGNNG